MPRHCNRSFGRTAPVLVVATAAAAAQAQPSGEAALAPVTVTAGSEVAPAELPPVLPGGQVARGARLGNLGNVDVFTTPFSVKSYTAQLIQDQGARSMDDLIANDPSSRVSLSSGFVLDQSSVRGFLLSSTSYRFDGLPGLISYSRVPLTNFERAEIVKGPSTAVFGASSGVGGTFNFVPKRATAQPVQSVTVAAGSRSMAEVHADLGRRFGPDGMFGARLNVLAEEGTLAVGTRRENFAPQLAFDMTTDRVRLNLDIGKNNYDNRGQGLNYTMAAGQPVPRVPDPRHRQSPAFANQAVPSHFALLGGEVDVMEGVVTAFARAGKFHEQSDAVVLSVGTLRGDGTYPVNSVVYNTWTTDNKVAETGLRARFATGPLAHQLTLSGLRYETLYAVPPGGQSQQPAGGFTPITGNIYTDYPVTDPFAAGRPQGLRYVGTPVVQNSWGFADSITTFGDRLNVVVGLRRQDIRSGSYLGERTSPTVAASWRLAPAWTAYGNYATALTQGAQAPANAANAGQNLSPYIGRQIEAGLKWNVGGYGVTLAAFEIRQASAFLDPADNVFKAAGEQRNRGVELETFGEVARGVRLLGGVAYIDGRQTKTLRGLTDGKRALGVSEVNANLGAEWDVAALPGLTLTGRAIHTGDAWVDAANTQRLPSWTRLDAGVRYATRWDQRRITLRAGVNNLADRAYWQTGGRNLFVVAEPRTWRLSATADF